jgi:hypothetical protein
MADPIIDVQPNRFWQNWHSSKGIGGPVARFYTPHNEWSDGSTTPDKQFAPGLAGLQSIVQQAEQDGKRVRALGSGWSLSSAPFVDDYLINTQRLSSWFLGFKTATLVDESIRDNADKLVFVQCGVQIKTLNTFLEAADLALPTSGASNGQTIAGAMSTGTHGSAHDVGAIQDYILGLHIVAEGGRHYWIERPSKPTMTQAFADWLGAEFKRDEDLFLSAVVSFGSFGLIHAVMFQAEPLYLLELFTKQFDFDDVVNACQRDPRNLGLPDGDAMPFHFEVLINPYRRKVGEGGAFIRVMYKRQLTGAVPSPPPTDGFTILSRDLVSIAGHFSDAVPAAVPGILQNKLMQSIQPTAPNTILATPGIQFGDSQPTNGGTSVEIGVPIGQSLDALKAIFSVTDAHVFGAPVALRFVRASDAILAFTCHSPSTCTIEMPGVDSDSARTAHPLIYQALADANIPATYHWGQQGPFTNESVITGYGQSRVDRWLAARRAFLKSPQGRKMFSNDLLDGCGLSG